ncbi:hypothetical protein LXL04_018194 [Taraxacum kok-saghyz]
MLPATTGDSRSPIGDALTNVSNNHNYWEGKPVKPKILSSERGIDYESMKQYMTPASMILELSHYIFAEDKRATSCAANNIVMYDCWTLLDYSTASGTSWIAKTKIPSCASKGEGRGGVNEPSRARIPPSSARARLSCCRLELELGSFKVWYPSSSSAREKCKKLELGSARLVYLSSLNEPRLGSSSFMLFELD